MADWKPMAKPSTVVQAQVKDPSAIGALQVYFTTFNGLY